MFFRFLTLTSICILSSFIVYAQQASLQGTVTTSDGYPLSSVSVRLLDTRWGAVTNENGSYSIQNIKPGEYTVQLTFTGEVKKTKTITLSPGNTLSIDFSIEQTVKQLEEVVVETNKIMNRGGSSSDKIPLSALEVPQVTHNISSVILRKQNAMTLEDAMKNVPGMTKLWDATSRPDGGSIFVSRGFQAVTKVRNGLPNVVNTNVEMANLEKIEVLKGPSATMFGSVVSSYGGLINRVTKKPYFHNGGSADVSYGSFNFYRASADINLVLQKEKLAARINVAGQNQDSWQDAGFQQSYIIAPSLLYKPNDRFTLHLDGEMVGSKGNSNGGNFMFVLNPGTINSAISGLLQQQGLPEQMVAAIMAQAPKTFKDAYGTDRIDELKPGYKRSFISNDVYTSTQSNAFFGVADYKISRHWTSQTAITFANSHNSGYSSYQYLLPNYPANFIRSFLTTGIPNFGAAGHDSVGRMVWNPVGSTKTFNIQQNFVADYTWGTVRNRTVLGLDFADYTSDVTYNRFYGALFGVMPYPDLFDVVATDGSSPKMSDLNKATVQAAFANRPPGTLPYLQKSSIYSGYVNNVTNITSYLIASAGVRIDHFKNNVLKDEQTKLSPKFGLIFMPVRDQLTIFANYQNSFTNKFGADKNNVAFKPEEANQTEIGIKYALFQNRLTGSLSYYDILAKNIIRTDLSDPQFNIQDGEQKSRGLEAEIVANPVKGWTLLFGYGYNKSKYVKADADVEGLRPVGSGPEHTFNAWTNYTFTKSMLKGLGIGVSLNYAGESYAFNMNEDGALILPSYAILGSHISYDTRRYRLGIKLNNIANKKYWMGWNSFIPQMPRQLIATIGVKF